MDEKRMAQLASGHAEELDAEFETFEHDGNVYHNVGLMQAWVRGYTDPDTHMMSDPPAWTDAFRAWLVRHGSALTEGMVGPPMVRFPDRATADLFRVEWHGRGRRRFPYAQQDAYLREFDRSNREILRRMRRTRPKEDGGQAVETGRGEE